MVVLDIPGSIDISIQNEHEYTYACKLLDLAAGYGACNPAFDVLFECVDEYELKMKELKKGFY